VSPARERGEMTKYEFLSQEWIDAIQRVKADHAGDAIDQPGLIVNATITGARRRQCRA
jgi:hypothetical protein